MKKSICNLVGFVVPTDYKVKGNESKKLNKFIWALTEK